MEESFVESKSNLDEKQNDVNQVNISELMNVSGPCLAVGFFRLMAKATIKQSVYNCWRNNYFWFALICNQNVYVLPLLVFDYVNIFVSYQQADLLLENSPYIFFTYIWLDTGHSKKIANKNYSLNLDIKTQTT